MNDDRSDFETDRVRSTLGETWAAFKTRWMHRLLYGGAALAMAYLSVRWSADGFGFAVSERYRWAGILIAICAVTVPEYMFITGHHRGNLTLTIGCLLGYGYGVASNWLGLWVATASSVSSPTPSPSCALHAGVRQPRRPGIPAPHSSRRTTRRLRHRNRLRVKGRTWVTRYRGLRPWGSGSSRTARLLPPAPTAGAAARR